MYRIILKFWEFSREFFKSSDYSQLNSFKNPEDTRLFFWQDCWPLPGVEPLQIHEKRIIWLMFFCYVTNWLLVLLRYSFSFCIEFVSESFMNFKSTNSSRTPICWFMLVQCKRIIKQMYTLKVNNNFHFH